MREVRARTRNTITAIQSGLTAMSGQYLILAEFNIYVQMAVMLVGAFVGGAAVLGFQLWAAKREGDARKREAERLIEDARERAAERLKAADVEAQKRVLEAKAKFEESTLETRNELKQIERRLDKREDGLDKKLDVLSMKERKIEEAQARIEERDSELDQKLGQVEKTLSEQRSELLRISKMSADEARQVCLQNIEQDVEREAGEIVERIIGHAEDNAKDRARYIIIQAIQRYAAEATSEAVVATVDVPSDEMKGRVIGREGRNIRAFEKATGVQVIVDDSPGIIMVSCYDPVRKEIARRALDQLIRDGRIHPTRIEELVASRCRRRSSRRSSSMRGKRGGPDGGPCARR
jgi:ribonuclease Y